MEGCFLASIDGQKFGTVLCDQCRSRKVRCDGGIGGCENCQSLNLACSFSGQQDTPPHPTRLRARRACVECRVKKFRCSGDTPPCERCLSLGLKCRYPPKRRIRRRQGSREDAVSECPATEGSAVPISTPAQLSAEEDGGFASSESTLTRAASPQCSSGIPCQKLTTSDIPKSMVRKYLDIFFKYIDPIPGLGFIHRPRLLQVWLDGRHNPRLLRVICGVASRFMSVRERRTLPDGQVWIDEAEKQIMQNIDPLEETDIASLILIAFDHGASGRFGRLKHLLNCGTKQAYLKLMNYENVNEGHLEPEWRRRLMWALWVLGTVNSGDEANCCCCSTDTIHISLPCDEVSFDRGTLTSNRTLQDARTSNDRQNQGLYAHLVHLLDIRRRIQRLMNSVKQKQLSETDDMSNMAVSSGFVVPFEQELSAFVDSFPSHYSLGPQNFCRYVSSPALTTFLMLHVWLLHTRGELYKAAAAFIENRFRLQSLVGQVQPTRELNHWRRQAFRNAVSMSSLFATALHIDPEICITDPMLAKCAQDTVSTILKQSTSGMAAAKDGQLWKSYLRPCAEILKRPSKFYPTVNLIYNAILEAMGSEIPSHEEFKKVAFGTAEGELAGEHLEKKSIYGELANKLVFQDPWSYDPLLDDDGQDAYLSSTVASSSICTDASPVSDFLPLASLSAIKESAEDIFWDASSDNIDFSTIDFGTFLVG